MKNQNPHKHFSKRIRDLRYKLNITQVEFATRLGVKQGTISKIEAGHILPGARLLMDMRRAFRLNINELFDEIHHSQDSHDIF